MNGKHQTSTKSVVVARPFAAPPPPDPRLPSALAKKRSSVNFRVKAWPWGSEKPSFEGFDEIDAHAALVEIRPSIHPL